MAEAETSDPGMGIGIRGSKKRKATTVPLHREREERLAVDDDDGDDGDGDGDDEKKMEEFFALVKKFREARDRLASSRPASAAGRADRLESVSAWDPRFQREDFMMEEEAVPVEKAMETLAFGPSRSAGGGAENNGEEGGLDLRLSL